MPSITYWNRLEPRPRTASITGTLGAEVRDPLWMLTRQWQFGELQGEDAGTPAWVRVERSLSRLDGWRAPGGALHPLDGSAPLELLALREPRVLDLATRVELGQLFEERLAARGAAPLTAVFRAAYPLPAAPDGDAEAARFLGVCGTRSLDGGALLAAARASAPSVPAQPPLSSVDATNARSALDDLSSWAEAVLGPIGDGAPAAWQDSQLSYQLEVEGGTPRGEHAIFTVQPAQSGDVEWFSFDLSAAPAPGGATPTRLPPLSLLPAHVRFRGMPTAGFWDFEPRDTDLGAMSPDLRDVAKLVFLEFLLVQGNDWYVLPLSQPTGTLSSIDKLIVRDVFGRELEVARAGSDDARWSLFSLGSAGDPSLRADFLLLPPTAAGALQRGPAIEEVRFLRDEAASMAWAIEETTANALGAPRPGAERSTASSPTPPPTDGRGELLRYRIQTQVPEHWLPLLPISLDTVRGEVALELAQLPASADPSTLVEPDGRLLRPALRVREEAVPREGARVRRMPFRCRWSDGSSWSFVARVRTTGAGSASSGLRFDTVTKLPTATMGPR
ncbi:MAG TPA: hypothetical protein VHT91_05385 [Kofleriaceae bacterium]|jgi:hypothetical protein|nr:hypothetical protein [Kofleriaceae bacterium]